MWKAKNRAQFESIIGELVGNEDLQSLKQQEQHSKHSSRYTHSIFVAYISFLACKRLNLDYEAAARGGMLHDFFFGGAEQGVKRLWKHPKDALENATQRYELNEMEQDIIVKHMWPLTRALPKHKESFVVSMADKVCCVAEVLHLDRLLGVKKNLTPEDMPPEKLLPHSA